MCVYQYQYIYISIYINIYISVDWHLNGEIIYKLGVFRCHLWLWEAKGIVARNIKKPYV